MELQNENERNEVDVNEEEGKEKERDNWKAGKTLSGEGAFSGAISIIAIAIAVIAMVIAVRAVSYANEAKKECSEANQIIAKLREQVSKLEEATCANVDESSSENEGVISELQKSVAEVKEASSENTEEISKLKQSLTEESEVSANANEDLFDLQKDMDSVEEKLSEHDKSITVLQGKDSKVDEVSGAISGIRSDISKANDRIGKAESRITELEKKPQSTSGNGESSSQDTNKKDDKKEDTENKYSKGVDCMYFYNVREEVKKAYRADKITYEQLKRYVEIYLTIDSMAANNSEISAEVANKYNDAIKDMSVIDYDKYHIKSMGKDYLRGFRDKIRYNQYNQVVTYYHDKEKVPDDVYDEYDKTVRNTSNSTSEKDITDTISHARRIINKYVGNPDEVITWNDWRGVTDVETFLDYID